jgi:hypothetical protein
LTDTKKPEKFYSIEEIISDAFAYSIEIERLHISLYLFKAYKDDALAYPEKSMKCLDIMITQLEKTFNRKLSVIPYLEE